MKVKILTVLVDQVNMKEAVAQVTAAVSAQYPFRVVTANPEMIYAASRDPKLSHTINTADLVTPDGVGVIWAANISGCSLAERVTGIDLLENLWPVADIQRWRVFILGSKQGVAEQAIQKISSRYPGIQWGFHHGYFAASEEAQVMETIRQFAPDVLLVGLGSPRQEHWLKQHADLTAVGIGVGGSFDTLSGLVPRAPLFIQKVRLEWLYRLWLEPKRRKRQAVLPKFVWAVLRSSWKNSKVTRE